MTTADARKDDTELPVTSPEQLREEFSQALDDLLEQLSPKTFTQNLVDDAKTATKDAVDVVRGSGLPQSDRRRRNAIAALCAGGLGLAALGVAVLKSARHS